MIKNIKNILLSYLIFKQFFNKDLRFILKMVNRIDFSEYAIRSGGLTETYGDPVTLPALGAITPSISGFSSGAYMSTQLQVIFSKLFKAVGVMAGGPYGCIPVFGVDDVCGGNGDHAYRMDIETLIEYALGYASKGLIDPISNLKEAEVWAESTTLDMLVNERVVAKVLDFYRAVGVPEHRLTFENKTVSPHAF
jgi:hypothetical protein